LQFWSRVDFYGLSSPISADVLGLAIEQAFWYPAEFNSATVSFLAQDASATAAGGGLISLRNGELRMEDQLFLAVFDKDLADKSSTLRELWGILWCIQSTARSTKAKLVFLCDNWQSCRAILRGSRVPEIQHVAELVFFWCMKHGKLCWPIWVPRTHRLIKEADRRSRLFIPHDVRAPLQVIACADKLARRLWGTGLSFDQAASHRTAIWVRGHRLRFNAVCYQPGADGVDMFSRIQSWAGQVNYVFPPAPMVGRLITFLPSTRARSIVVIPLPVPHAWWSFAVQSGARGLVDRAEICGFAVFAFDITALVPRP
jgi:hypothetical protein